MRFQPVESPARTSVDVVIILRKQFEKWGGRLPSRWYWNKFWPKELAQAEKERSKA